MKINESDRFGRDIHLQKKILDSSTVSTHIQKPRATCVTSTHALTLSRCPSVEETTATVLPWAGGHGGRLSTVPHSSRNSQRNSASYCRRRTSLGSQVVHGPAVLLQAPYSRSYLRTQVSPTDHFSKTQPFLLDRREPSSGG